MEMEEDERKRDKERLQFGRIIGMTIGFLVDMAFFACSSFLPPLLCLPVPLLSAPLLFRHLSWLWIFL